MESRVWGFGRMLDGDHLLGAAAHFSGPTTLFPSADLSLFGLGLGLA